MDLLILLQPAIKTFFATPKFAFLSPVNDLLDLKTQNWNMLTVNVLTDLYDSFVDMSIVINQIYISIFTDDI